MRPRFSPVGWPGAPASSSVRSPIAEKGSGIPRAPLLPTVKCQPDLAVASIGELPISGGAGRGMNMSKLSAHARPSRPSSFTVAFTVALTVALTVCSEGERGATPKPSVCVIIYESRMPSWFFIGTFDNFVHTEYAHASGPSEFQGRSNVGLRPRPYSATAEQRQSRHHWR